MATFQIKMSGNPGVLIQAKIDKITKQASDIIQFAGLNCEGLAKQACPVDTGRLRSSIKYTKQSDSSCTCDTNVNYAWYVELGTHRMVARPFLVPAFKRAQKELLQELKAIK